VSSSNITVGWLYSLRLAFILIQLVILIDFAHSWAENWIEKMEFSEEGDNRWWRILLGSTLTMYAFSITMTIIMYVFFVPDAAHCGTNVAFISVNLALCILLSFISIHPKVQEYNERSGLLQSALIAAYSTYLIFSAVMSDDQQCNPWRSSASALNVSVLIGAIFTIMAVCYATIRASSSIGEYNIQEETQPLVKKETKEDKEEKAEKGEKTETAEKEKEEEHDSSHHSDAGEPVSYHFSRFHAVFALGAMYIAMLMTDWNTVYHPTESRIQVDTGLAAVWVKVISSWMVALFYLWTLAAPVMFPDREWH